MKEKKAHGYYKNLQLELLKEPKMLKLNEEDFKNLTGKQIPQNLKNLINSVAKVGYTVETKDDVKIQISRELVFIKKD